MTLGALHVLDAICRHFAAVYDVAVVREAIRSQLDVQPGPHNHKSHVVVRFTVLVADLPEILDIEVTCCDLHLRHNICGHHAH